MNGESKTCSYILSGGAVTITGITPLDLQSVTKEIVSIALMISDTTTAGAHSKFFRDYRLCRRVPQQS